MGVFEVLLIGFGIGLGAGVSPGPLLTLTISSTLERGFGAGARVASAPLFTDLPIFIASLVILSRLPEGFLTALSLVGGVAVAFVGGETAWRAFHPPEPSEEPPAAHQDLIRGMLVNVLSPHPWITWLTILGPQILALWNDAGVVHAAGFGILFYVGLVGSKIVIAWGVARSRHLLSGRGYRAVLLICALLLVVLGGVLFVQGLQGLY